MKTKRFLSLAVALCMVLAFVPAMASAAAEEKVLFDVANLAITGEQNIDQGGWTATENGAAIRWNQNWGDNGVWGSQGTYALMFFFTNQRGTSDGNAEATINNAADTKGAEKISIDFNFACQDAADLYQRWNFKDNDGNTFATFYFDKNVKAEAGTGNVSIAATGADVLAMRGQAVNITATKNAEGKYDVVYTVNGNVVTTETVESINGFKSINAEVYSWNQQYAAAGLQNLKITYEVPETMKEVTAAYTVNGETVATVNGIYDTASEEGAAFPAKSVIVDGELYTAEAVTLSDSAEVAMTVGERYSSVNVGDVVSSEGNTYTITTDSLIVNGDFRYGMTGWTTRQGAEPAVATEAVEGISATVANPGGINGVASANNFGTAWKIEKGKTYYLSFWVGNLKGSMDYCKVIATDNTADITGDTKNMTALVQMEENADWKHYEKAFEATTDYIFVVNSWINSGMFANFELHEAELKDAGTDATVTFVTEAGETVKTMTKTLLAGESFTVPAEEVFMLDGNFYQIPETVVTETTTVTLTPVANKYGVIEDALVSDNEIWGIKKTNDNSIFVAAGADVNRAPLADANGTPLRGSNDPSTLGKSRVGFVEFPVVDLADGQKAVAHFYVRDWHGNGFSNGNDSLRVAAFVVNDSSWTALADGNSYDSANAPILEAYPNAIFSDVNYRTEDLTFDVTEAMKAAKAAGLEKFDLRLNSAWGAAYIAEREAAVEGGKYEGKAAYIEVVDAGAVNVTTTSVDMIKNGGIVGKSAAVTAGDDVRFNSDAAVVLAGGKLYIPKETKAAAEAADLETTELTEFGIEMKGGQVRVGKGVTAENKVGENSGIRFVAVVNRENTIANEASKIGVTLTAAGSDKSVDVPTVKFQDDTETVFTVAVTNLDESNYNRKYTAVPYAKVTLADGSEKTFTGNGATRSAYAVSAGLLKNGAVDLVEGDTYAVDEAVASVLNAYVNQTGVRIVIENGAAVAASTYTGDVFFDVKSVKNGDSYEITITPDQTFKTPVTIADWWKDYVRVNNNNSTAKGFISNEKIENGVLTFTFTPVA